MIIDETNEYNLIGDKVYSVLGFTPSCEYRGHSLNVPLPFAINVPYVVYAIDSMVDDSDQMDELIRDCLIKCAENMEWYALDWQHSSFRFNPENIEEMKSIWVEDNKY